MDHLPAPPGDQKLMADGGPLQLSLFDQQDLAQITSPDFPGERLIACRNPFEAAKRARTHEDLLAATETDLGKIAAHVATGRVPPTGSTSSAPVPADPLDAACAVASACPSTSSPPRHPPSAARST